MSTDRISEYLAQFSQTRSQMIEPARPRHRRPDRGHRADPGRHLHARPLPAGRRARPGQDADGQLDQPDPRRLLQAHPVHARPDAVRHHRHDGPRRARGRPARVPLRRGADLRQHPPGRRDQPHAAQDAGRPARRPCRNARSPSGQETYKLPEPFFVIATQNPIEQEGTYPLPEAQLDRFMFNIKVDYPSYRRGKEDPGHDRQGRGGRADEGAHGQGDRQPAEAGSQRAGRRVRDGLRHAAGAGDAARATRRRRTSSRRWSITGPARAPASS